MLPISGLVHTAKEHLNQLPYPLIQPTEKNGYAWRRLLPHLRATAGLNVQNIENYKDEITDRIIEMLAAQKEVGENIIARNAARLQESGRRSLDEFRQLYLANLDDDTFMRIVYEMNDIYMSEPYDRNRAWAALSTSWADIVEKHNLDRSFHWRELLWELVELIREFVDPQDWVDLSTIVGALGWKLQEMTREQRFALWEVLTTDPHIAARLFIATPANPQRIVFCLRGEVPEGIDTKAGSAAITHSLWEDLFGEGSWDADDES